MPRVSTKSFSYPQDAFENFKEAFVSREPTSYGDVAFVERLKDLLGEFPDRWTDAEIVAMLTEMHSKAETAQLQSLLNKAKQIDPQGSGTRRGPNLAGNKTKPKSDKPTGNSENPGKSPIERPKSSDPTTASARQTAEDAERAALQTMLDTEETDAGPVGIPTESYRVVDDHEARQTSQSRGIEN